MQITEQPWLLRNWHQYFSYLRACLKEAVCLLRSLSTQRNFYFKRSIMPYRNYLLTGKNIPRQTLHSRKKAAEREAIRRIENELKEYQSASTRIASTSRNITNTSNNNMQAPASEENSLAQQSVTMETGDIEEPRVNQENNRSPLNVKPSQPAAESIAMDTSIDETSSTQDDFIPKSPVTDTSDNEEQQLHEEVNPSPGNEVLHQTTESISLNAYSEELRDDHIEEPDSSGFEQDEAKRLNQRLCNCVKATVGDVVFMCLSLGLRHNLTWAAQVDIFRMFFSIYEASTLPQTTYSYFKELDVDKHKMAFHTFCPKCETYMGERQEKKGSLVCSNEQCGELVDVSKPSSFFLSLCMEAQLQILLSDPDLAKLMMTHRFNRVKTDKDALEDIYDGEEYQRHFQAGGVLSSPNNFSYSFFVDGISTGKSTCKTMWPIYFVVNELPYKERSKKIMLAGLYVGSKDPNHLVFLKPFVKQANRLSTTGFTLHHEGKTLTCKAIPLCAVMDSVARYQVLNMQSFIAYWGCTFCYQQQKSLGGRRKRFDILSKKGEERTPESTYHDAVKALERKDEPQEEDRHFRGVKGFSVLSTLLFFNIIWGCAIDYLHAFLLGLAKTHMEFIFDTRRRKLWEGLDDDRVGLEHVMKAIDERLLSIKPPTSITRIPRSITKYKNWKASEWRSWLLFYCIPCLKGLLKDKYLDHLAFLSKGTFILLQRSIAKNQVHEAHRYFINYAYFFQKYFDPQTTYYNIHLLTHVCKCVLMWGPLWSHDAFPFEGHNRHLLQLMKSPSNVVFQIARKHLVYMSLPSICSKIVSSVSTLEFVEELLSKRMCRFVRASKCVLAGKGSCITMYGQEELCLLESRNTLSKDCLFFQRVLFRGMRISTYDYCHDKSNDNSFVSLMNGAIFSVRYIVLLPSKEVVLMGRRVRFYKRQLINNKDLVLNHIRRVKRLEDDLSLFNPSNVKSQCVAINCSSGETINFLSEMPFGCYGD